MPATDCLVYLGPSLARREAERLLPEAIHLPPAACLDVTLALRLRPRLIVLIDGVYETVGSVWHKELLLALEQGVEVLGGASMGALRAAELAPFGMEGVGAIFNEYLTGACTDDDDVAVLQAADGTAMTDAIVNIRATLRQACRSGVLPEALARQVLVESKRQFYQERTIRSVIDALVPTSSASDAALLEAFVIWCRDGGFVDQKALDARETLARAREILDSPPRHAVPPRAPRTVFLRRLQQLAEVSPFAAYHPALPYDEQVALAARFLGITYVESRRVALFLQAVNGVCGGVPILCDGDDEWLLAIETAHASWLEPLDLPCEYAAHLLRLDGQFAVLRRGSKDPVATLEVEDPPRYRRVTLAARLWRLVEAVAARQGLRLSHDQLQDRAELFRQQHQLASDAAVADWMKSNALSFRQFQSLITSWTLFEHAEHLQPRSFEDVSRQSRWWLRDALHLTGAYAAAESLLTAARRGLPVRVPESDEEAFRCDFQTGVWGARCDLRAMAAACVFSSSSDSSVRSVART